MIKSKYNSNAQRIASFCSLSVHSSHFVFIFLSFWISYAINTTNIIIPMLVTIISNTEFLNRKFINHQIIIQINQVNARLHSFVRSLFVVYQYHHIIINIAVVAQNIDTIEFSSNAKNITDRNTPFIAL